VSKGGQGWPCTGGERVEDPTDGDLEELSQSTCTIINPSVTRPIHHYNCSYTTTACMHGYLGGDGHNKLTHLPMNLKYCRIFLVDWYPSSLLLLLVLLDWVLLFDLMGAGNKPVPSEAAMYMTPSCVSTSMVVVAQGVGSSPRHKPSPLRCNSL